MTTDRTEYVVGFLIDPRWREVALLLKARPAWQKGLLNGIGGKVEAGETPLQAMIRECGEEASGQPVSGGWFHRVTVEFEEVVVHFYLAHIREGDERSEGRWDEPIRWFPVDALPANMVPNVRWLLPLCMDTAVAGPIRLTATDVDVDGSIGEAF